MIINKRMDVQVDRLSSLREELIHKILSFVGIKDAIKTSALSSRWRYIWTSMPYLTFSCQDIHTSPNPSKFITDVFSHRNDQIGLSSIKLTCFSNSVVKSILNYASCCYIQQLTLKGYRVPLTDEIKLPVSVFSSKSLKHLTLRGSFCIEFSTPTSTLELFALTTLHLDHVKFYNNSREKCIDPFSKCVNLKNLTLNCCSVRGSNGFRICQPRLSNLTITTRTGKIFKHMHFSTDSLQMLDLCISCPDGEVNAGKISGMFRRLHGVKFLTLNMELVQCLSLSMKLISPPPSPFAQLKSLKIHQAFVDKSGHQLPLSNEIQKYFLDSSPNASFTLIPPKVFTCNTEIIYSDPSLILCSKF